MKMRTADKATRRTFHSGERIDGWLHGRLSTAPTHVPVKWELVYLTSVARLESGHTPSRRHPEYWDGDIPWISLHDSAALDVPEIRSTALTISELGLENSSARLLPPGTVVFSRTATVGKSTVMGRQMATSQDFANYICGDRLHNHYLVHLFRYMAPEWKGLMAGSTHNSIYMPVFQDLQIFLPPHAEQIAIAEALNDADVLIESLEQALAKKNQIKRGTMQELLTGKKRLPGFSEKWKVRALAEIAPLQRGFDLPTGDLKQGPYPVVYSNAPELSLAVLALSAL
jgi:type I restriction enzyme S subunit